MVSRVIHLFSFVCLLAVITWSLFLILCWNIYTRADIEWTVPKTSVGNDIHVVSNPVTSTFPIIDVLSTGSITRPEYQVAQEEFLRQHPSIRHIFQATEVNDTEIDCHSRLNSTQLLAISKKCRNWKSKQRTPLLARLTSGFASFRFLQKKANPVGWMCAQKRPLIALWQILQKYTELPDYLFMIDDDTWFQMDALVSNLTQQYPPHQPSLIAGCQIKFRHDNFTIPFGGFGMIFTKAALARWTKPLIGCNPVWNPRSKIEEDEYVQYSCDRYQRHHRIGEQIKPELLNKRYMTVADILYSYTQRANYTDVKNWDGIGYCLHSDWAIAYFAAEYHITFGGEMQAYQNSHIAKGVRTGGCRNAQLASCPPNATVCHRMTPEGMRERMKNTIS